MRKQVGSCDSHSRKGSIRVQAFGAMKAIAIVTLRDGLRGFDDWLQVLELLLQQQDLTEKQAQDTMQVTPMSDCLEFQVDD